MISAVVLTKNEEKNIKKCLESLKWCDEMVVIDDYSSDKTVKIAKQLGAKVYQRHLNNNFASQRNFGLEKAKGEWILFIDADERINPRLRIEIIRSSKSSKNKGFYIKRTDFLFGKKLKHGETDGIKLLRLARKETGKWQRKVHEIWQIEGKIGELRNPLLHYPHQTISEFLKQINFYSTLHAKALREQGVKPSLFRIIANPLGKFIQNYILKLGFFDGTTGFIVAAMMSFHSFLAQAKLFKEKKVLIQKYVIACHKINKLCPR